MDVQPSQELRALIQKVSGGATLTEEEIRTALDQMTAGAATPAQMGAFLMALRVRGETVEEITGAAQMLRSRMNRVEVAPDAIDVVGTGGDSHGTYNVSTCAALVAAGAGVKVAKHGNRRVSSRPAPPTCWPSSASSSTCRSTPSRAAWRRPGSASCGRRSTTRP